MAGWATTGFTTAPFASRACPTSTIRRRRAVTRPSGGRATSTTTTCSWRPGSAGELGRRRGLEQVGFWRKILEHPSYDAFWRDQAVDKILAAQPLKVPVMLVHSLWDQEDIYGAIAVYKAIEPKDTDNDKVFLVHGPVASRPG